MTVLFDLLFFVATFTRQLSVNRYSVYLTLIALHSYISFEGPPSRIVSPANPQQPLN